MNVDSGTELIEGANAITTDLGGGRHGGMVRVHLLDHRAQVVERVPVRRIVSLFPTFGLIADAPEEDGRMIAVAIDNLTNLLHLFADLRRVFIVKTLLRLAKPEADG